MEVLVNLAKERALELLATLLHGCPDDRARQRRGNGIPERGAVCTTPRTAEAAEGVRRTTRRSF